MFLPRSALSPSIAPTSDFCDRLDEKFEHGRRSSRRDTASNPAAHKSIHNAPAKTTLAAPSVRSPTQPLAVPARASVPARVRSPRAAVSRSQNNMSLPARRTSESSDRRVSGGEGGIVHNANALPPAVAALLAVTAIPRPKPDRFRSRRRPATARRISIDELVNDWKSDQTLGAALSSSPALTMLLEDADDRDEQSDKGCDTDTDSFVEQQFLQIRSASSESTPSLEVDRDSEISASFGSLSTPHSLQSRRSSSYPRKRALSSLAAEICPLDHPLVEKPVVNAEPDEVFILASGVGRRKSAFRPQASFKSNLTASLQALKNAALSSINSIGRASPQSTQHRISSAGADELLWSLPFLSFRLSPEFRPADEQRGSTKQYPTSQLNFEELEAPYQQALHAPYLAQHRDDLPCIPMQTYTARAAARRRAGLTHASRPNPTADPTSEAGRALLGGVGAPGPRLREPRENSDFLRVVVLEMNMRREGKLEGGRARIWLPPRSSAGYSEPSSTLGQSRSVPRRWESISAYD